AAANVVDEKRTYISLEDLPMMYRKKKVIFKQRPLKETIEEFEKSIIEDTLNFYDNNVSESAKALSMPRQTLQQKMKKYNFYRLP
ncbi:MAG: helix-turn-helix domain-containing protein, partial [Oscillospiraceae bacterium]